MKSWAKWKWNAKWVSSEEIRRSSTLNQGTLMILQCIAKNLPRWVKRWSKTIVATVLQILEFPLCCNFIWFIKYQGLIFVNLGMGLPIFRISNLGAENHVSQQLTYYFVFTILNLSSDHSKIEWNIDKRKLQHHLLSAIGEGVYLFFCIITDPKIIFLIHH